MRGWTSVLLVGALVIAASGCTRRATQLVVRVDSDLAAADRACVHVAVARVGTDEPPIERVFHTGARDGVPIEPRGETPFSFGVTPPEGDASRRVEITVTAMRAGAGCDDGRLDPSAVSVSRRVRTGFLSQQTLLLPVFLDRRCDGAICDPDQTCEGGSCIAVPDVAPDELVPVVPGTELEVGLPDASFEPDASVERDAAFDDTGDAGPLDFASLRPDPLFALETPGPLDPIYPVGVNGDRVLLAGLSRRADLVVDGRPIDGSAIAKLWLAQLTVTGSTDWLVTLDVPAPYPVPTIQRVVPFPGGFVLCGTAPPDGLVALGSPLVCTGHRCAFIARLDPGGAITAIRVVDAARFDTMDEADTVCTDLSIRGAHAYVAIVSTYASSLLVDGAPVTLAAGVLEPGGGQSLVALELLDVATSFSVEPPRVVGHDAADPAPRATPLVMRPVGVDGLLYAGRGEVLEARTGAVPDGGAQEIRVQRAGDAFEWNSAPILAGGYPTNSRVELEAMAASDVHMWIVVTVTPNAGAMGQQITFGSLPTFDVARRTSYAVTIDAVSGRPLAATPASTTPYLAGEDFTLSREEPLTGGGLAMTPGDDLALFAAAGANGDPVSGTILSGITGDFAGVVVIARPDGTVRTAWRWDHRPELDVRLTHVEVLPGGFVAVGGYVEDDTVSMWRRASSFVEIYPPR